MSKIFTRTFRVRFSECNAYGQALLGVQDGAAPAQWVGGGEACPERGRRGGVWRLLSQTVTATSDQLVLYLHGHNGTGLNTNVYFDDVTVTELGQ